MAAEFESAAIRINRRLIICDMAAAAWLRERPEPGTPTRQAKRKVGHPTVDNPVSLNPDQTYGKVNDRTEAIRILPKEEGVPETSANLHRRLLKKSQPIN